jgi:DNA-binding transcriptional regulator YiaG
MTCNIHHAAKMHHPDKTCNYFFSVCCNTILAVPIDPTSKLPQRELEICARVREVREGEQMSMPVFAKALGITRQRLGSYEYGRAPLRYSLGKRIGELFDINQRWLATGQPPKRYYIDPHTILEGGIPSRALFSEGYDYIKPYIEHYLAKVCKALGVPLESVDTASAGYAVPPEGMPLDKGLQFLLSSLVGLDLRWLPDELRYDYFKRIAVESRKFMAESEERIAELKRQERLAQSVAKETGKKVLHDVSTIGNTPDMKSKMQTLRERLKRATKERGSKAELARHLGVALPKVSAWLAGSIDPNGETTLRLVEWVERRE